jgi:hypothetical protein
VRSLKEYPIQPRKSKKEVAVERSIRVGTSNQKKESDQIRLAATCAQKKKSKKKKKKKVFSFLLVSLDIDQLKRDFFISFCGTIELNKFRVLFNFQGDTFFLQDIGSKFEFSKNGLRVALGNLPNCQIS